ncbi:MAG TPA: hypothetical protein PKZ97_13250 [Azospirillaceae bacterium]|nr:hypothetical protein [Azospirillaceae bacterium]
MEAKTMMLIADVLFSFVMVLAVGWLFENRQKFGAVAVAVGSLALAALALVVGGVVFHSLRALAWTICGAAGALLIVGLKAVCAMWVARSNR